MPAKKLVVSTYLQCVLIGAVAPVLFAVVRQLGGLLLTFLLAGVLAYALNPLVRWIEERGIQRVVVALFFIIVPAAGQVGTLVRNSHALMDGAAIADRVRDVPYVGERVAALDRQALYEFARVNAPLAGQVYNGALRFIGGVFGMVLNLVLMLIISVYPVLDREWITRATLAAIPETFRGQAVELFTPWRGR